MPIQYWSTYTSTLTSPNLLTTMAAAGGSLPPFPLPTLSIPSTSATFPFNGPLETQDHMRRGVGSMIPGAGVFLGFALTHHPDDAASMNADPDTWACVYGKAAKRKRKAAKNYNRTPSQRRSLRPLRPIKTIRTIHAVNYFGEALALPRGLAGSHPANVDVKIAALVGLNEKQTTEYVLRRVERYAANQAGEEAQNLAHLNLLRAAEPLPAL